MDLKLKGIKNGSFFEERIMKEAIGEGSCFSYMSFNGVFAEFLHWHDFREKLSFFGEGVSVRERRE